MPRVLLMIVYVTNFMYSFAMANVDVDTTRFNPALHQMLKTYQRRNCRWRVQTNYNLQPPGKDQQNWLNDQDHSEKYKNWAGGFESSNRFGVTGATLAPILNFLWLCSVQFSVFDIFEYETDAIPSVSGSKFANWYYTKRYSNIYTVS